MLWRQSPRGVSEARRNQSQFIGYRPRRTDRKLFSLELRPLPPVIFLAAGENLCAHQGCFSRWLCSAPIICYARVQATQKPLACRWIEDATSDCCASDRKANRDTPFRNSVDKFASSIQRVHNPHHLFREASAIIRIFFGEPAFTGLQQNLSQHAAEACDRPRSPRYGHRGRAPRTYRARTR